MQATLYLAAASFATALFTAAVGIGGGLGLLSVMPSFMPISAVVPVHGLTQFFSNASRFLFDYRQAKIRLLPAYFGGACFVVQSAIYLLAAFQTFTCPRFSGSLYCCAPGLNW